MAKNKNLGTAKVEKNDEFYGCRMIEESSNKNIILLIKLKEKVLPQINSFVDAEKISPQNSEAVKWCVANGILRGNADGSFNPEGNVTRAQMATILQNWIREFAVNQ